MSDTVISYIRENLFFGDFRNWWWWLILIIITGVVSEPLAKFVCKRFFPKTWEKWQAEEVLQEKQADERKALKQKHKVEVKELKMSLKSK